MACSFCQTTKPWKEKEIEDHLQSHGEVKLLNERVLAPRQKRRELIANANAVNQKMQKVQAEYEEAKRLISNPKYDLAAAYQVERGR